MPLYVEIGNSTIKAARFAADGGARVERYDDVAEFMAAIGATSEEIVAAPVGHALSESMRPHLRMHTHVTIIEHAAVAEFIGYSYDAPEALGLDRVLNLLGLDGDGIVVSCGTAITVDAVRAGRPSWGAILPGLRTAADGLHARIPNLPLLTLDEPTHLPARTSVASVANGVLLGAACAVQGVVRALELVVFGGARARVVLTGGDAAVLGQHWAELPVPSIDEAILFRGMVGLVGG